MQSTLRRTPQKTEVLRERAIHCNDYKSRARGIRIYIHVFAVYEYCGY